jgi:glycosyltransferase involved in cell wall biosynthesis
VRIAVVPSFLAPVRADACFGGAEVLALQLAEGLARRGHHVLLLGVEGSAGEGLEVFVAPPTPAFRPGDVVPIDPAPFRATLRDAATQVDVLHLHLNDPGALLAAAELADERPALHVVSTLHLSAVFPATTEVVRRLVDRGARITFTSPSESARRSYAREAIVVVPNGVEPERVPFGARPESGTALWAGRRVPEKGYADALAIAARAHRRLHVAGPPPDPGAPPLPAASRGTVIDHGRLSRAALAARLAAVEVTLVPSTISEAHPLIAIESVLAGTPVVGYTVGGLPEIVTDDVGRLVEVGDIEAAARAVAAVRTLDRAEVRARAVTRFSAARMLDDFVRLYRGSPTR